MMASGVQLRQNQRFPLGPEEPPRAPKQQSRATFPSRGFEAGLVRSVQAMPRQVSEQRCVSRNCMLG